MLFRQMFFFKGLNCFRKHFNELAYEWYSHFMSRSAFWTTVDPIYQNWRQFTVTLLWGIWWRKQNPFCGVMIRKQFFILIEVRTNVSDETVASIFSIRIPQDGCTVFPQAHNYLSDHSDTSIVKQLTIIITLWNKMSAFLGCHAMQICNYLPTFRYNQSIPSTRVSQ